jgi:hypothetical protein
LFNVIAALDAGESPASTQTQKLLVWDHSLDLGGVRVAYQDGLAQLAFALFVLGRQHMAQVRVVALDLAGRGLLEALGGTLMGFQLGHKSSVQQLALGD